MSRVRRRTCQQVDLVREDDLSYMIQAVDKDGNPLGDPISDSRPWVRVECGGQSRESFVSDLDWQSGIDMRATKATVRFTFEGERFELVRGRSAAVDPAES